MRGTGFVRCPTMAKRKVWLTREPRTAYLAEADHFRKFAELCNKLYSGLVARRDGWGCRKHDRRKEGETLRDKEKETEMVVLAKKRKGTVEKRSSERRDSVRILYNRSTVIRPTKYEQLRNDKRYENTFGNYPRKKKQRIVGFRHSSCIFSFATTKHLLFSQNLTNFSIN